MIVYVESNFVLELALVQEKSDSCENILQLAEGGAIRIATPAFSLGEPYETLVRRHRERRLLAVSVAKEIAQLRRCTHYKERVKNADALHDLLDESGTQEQNVSIRHYPASSIRRPFCQQTATSCARRWKHSKRWI